MSSNTSKLLQVLSQGGKYEIYEEDGSAHLEIYDSDAADSGVYTCAAKNFAGSVSTNCTVTVKGIKLIKFLKCISLLVSRIVCSFACAIVFQ